MTYRFDFTFDCLLLDFKKDIVINEAKSLSVDGFPLCVILTDISSLSGLIDLLGRCSRCCCGEGLVLLNCLTGQKTLHLLPSVDWMKSPCKEAILWVRKKTCFHIGQNWVGKSAVILSILSKGPFYVAILPSNKKLTEPWDFVGHSDLDFGWTWCCCHWGSWKWQWRQ